MVNSTADLANIRGKSSEALATDDLDLADELSAIP